MGFTRQDNLYSEIRYYGQISSATNVIYASDFWLQSLLYVVIGTGGTAMTIEDGESTPLVLGNGIAITSASTVPVVVVGLDCPGIPMKGGLKITLTGSSPTVNIWMQGWGPVNSQHTVPPGSGNVVTTGI